MLVTWNPQSVPEMMHRPQGELGKSINVLRDKETELKRTVERVSAQDSLDIDEAVTTTAPLYKQSVPPGNVA